MKPYTIKIAAGAKEIYTFGSGADYVRLATVGAGILVTVCVDETDESYVLGEGDEVFFSEFSRLRVSHSSAVEQTIKLYIGRGTRAGSSKVSGSITVKSASGMVSADDLVIPAPGAVLVFAANGARVEAVITNLSSSVGTVRVGDALVTASRGIPIEPGMSARLETTAAIYVYSSANGGDTISRVEFV